MNSLAHFIFHIRQTLTALLLDCNNHVIAIEQISNITLNTTDQADKWRYRKRNTNKSSDC